jgi:glycosyltransferase involved in cell wall biosynthesis
MPSYSEGFPLAFIEATSFGLPILVSDLPIFREITHKDEVIFVRLNDVNSMTDAIHNLIKNRNNLSKMSYMAFTSRFDSVIMGNKYLKLFLDTKTT